MKALLYVLCLGLLASSAQATVKYSCESGENKVAFTVKGNQILNFSSNGEPDSGLNPEADRIAANGSASYSFYFYDYADTNYWIVVELLNEKVLSAKELTSGNDSDNYDAQPTENKVLCNVVP